MTLAAARAILFVPGDRPEWVDGALASGADAVVLDLEDGLAGEQKSAGRCTVLATVARLRRPEVGVRISSLSTPDGVRDVAALLDAAVRPAFLVIPKVRSAAEALTVVDALQWDGEVVCGIESVEGIHHATEIAAVCDHVTAVGFGAVDLAAQLGAQLDWAPLAAARAQVVWAAAAAGVAAFDAPCLDLTSSDALVADCGRAAAMGFTGKIAIHPDQVCHIRAQFTPTAEEVEDARAMLAAGATGAAARHRGAMVDRATLRRAAQLVARAEEAG